MDIQTALIRIGACESYVDASDLLIKGRITLNGKRVDWSWHELRGGYYAINVKKVGMFRFNVRGGKVGKVKRGLTNEQTGI